MAAKSSSYWESEEEKKKMEEEVTRDNCGNKLRLIRDISGISRRDLAEVLDVQESTIYRIERGITKPSEDFMNRLRALQVIGVNTFKKMSNTEKKKVAETIGLGTGIGAGVGASVATISVAGSVGGLSAAGITSGLAAIGGSMLGGIAVVASIPAAAGVLGYGIVKGIRKIIKKNKLSRKEIDERYEVESKDVVKKADRNEETKNKEN